MTEISMESFNNWRRQWLVDHPDYVGVEERILVDLWGLEVRAQRNALNAAKYANAQQEVLALTQELETKNYACYQALDAIFKHVLPKELPWEYPMMATRYINEAFDDLKNKISLLEQQIARQNTTYVLKDGVVSFPEAMKKWAELNHSD